MTRDHARRRLDRAERSAFSWNSVALSPEEANAFLAAVLRTRWFKRRYPLVASNGVVIETSTSLRVKVSRCRFNAEDSQAELFRTLRVDRLRRTRLALLHALAHLVSGEAAHGREYASTLVLLINRFLGRAAALEFVKALEREGVRWRRRRRFSSEKLTELRARFEFVRKRPKAGEESFAGEE